MILTKEFIPHATWTRTAMEAFGESGWTHVVAAALDVSERTVRNWARDGKDLSIQDAAVLEEAVLRKICLMLKGLSIVRVVVAGGIVEIDHDHSVLMEV